nr:immunoglobulin heavy chain junction region [Mus musculus]
CTISIYYDYDWFAYW